MICLNCGAYYQGEWGRRFCSTTCELEYKARRAHKNRRYQDKKHGRVVLPCDNRQVMVVNDTWDDGGWRPGALIGSKMLDRMLSDGYAPSGMVIELQGRLYRVRGDSPPQRLEIV